MSMCRGSCWGHPGCQDVFQNTRVQHLDTLRPAILDVTWQQMMTKRWQQATFVDVFRHDFKFQEAFMILSIRKHSCHVWDFLHWGEVEPDFRNFDGAASFVPQSFRPFVSFVAFRGWLCHVTVSLRRRGWTNDVSFGKWYGYCKFDNGNRAVAWIFIC